MSVVTPGNGTCACQHEGQHSGAMSLKVVPSPSVSNHPEIERVKELAQEVENAYFDHALGVSTHSYLKSHHAHLSHGPEHDELPHLMQQSGLTLRVQHTDHTDHVVCAEVTPSALADILRDGVATVDAPMNRGSFRLHSALSGHVTGVEFIPS